jgi:ABC-type molybdenum transport system ATPase subunit/photorepair protein PhrA
MAEAAHTHAIERPPSRPSLEELAERPTVIEVDRLDWSFGARQVLYDISLQVREGEIMVIMGGSAQTTLLRHLVGLMPPVAGKVTCSARTSGPCVACGGRLSAGSVSPSSSERCSVPRGVAEHQAPPCGNGAPR